MLGASTGNGERRMPFQSTDHCSDTCINSPQGDHSGVVFSNFREHDDETGKRNRQNLAVLLQLYCLKAKEQALLACTNKAKGLSNRNIGFVYDKGIEEKRLVEENGIEEKR